MLPRRGILKMLVWIVFRTSVINKTGNIWITLSSNNSKWKIWYQSKEFIHAMIASHCIRKSNLLSIIRTEKLLTLLNYVDELAFRIYVTWWYPWWAVLTDISGLRKLYASWILTALLSHIGLGSLLWLILSWRKTWKLYWNSLCMRRVLLISLFNVNVKL